MLVTMILLIVKEQISCAGVEKETTDAEHGYVGHCRSQVSAITMMTSQAETLFKQNSQNMRLGCFVCCSIKVKLYKQHEQA